MPSRCLLDEMDYSFQNLKPVLLSHKAKILLVGCRKLICPLLSEVQVWIEKNKNNFLMEALKDIQYSIEKELHNHNNAVCSKNLVSLHSTNSAAFLKERSLSCSANWFWKLRGFLRSYEGLYGRSLVSQSRRDFSKKKKSQPLAAFFLGSLLISFSWWKRRTVRFVHSWCASCLVSDSWH